jgi:hypothetical protein
MTAYRHATGAVMTTDPFSAFEFDADDAGRVLMRRWSGADDGELFLETSASESLAFDDGRLKSPISTRARLWPARRVW